MWLSFARIIKAGIFQNICKLYKTGTFCPFEEIGCKFRHEGTTREGDNLVGDISFRMNEEGTTDDDNIENIENVEDEVQYEETDEEEVDLWDGPVPCDHCADFFDMRDKLLEHMKRNHMQVLLSQYHPNSFLPIPLVPELLSQRQPAAVLRHGHAEHLHPQQPQPAERKR